VLQLVQRHARVQVYGDDRGVLETALFLEVSFLGIASVQAARKAMVALRDRFMRIRSLSTCECLRSLKRPTSCYNSLMHLSEGAC
jgi:hypothetical protein